ncbi:hypothetical protein HPT25_03935 [Bacillus sp. BRMEA1]|uniref:hypothetical protein n=1 Tax=Neobacillus endophyticus TaxID=2738405 RepID=UPI0015635D0C|nr:hypothetical protein [Neobacillus endophyticus]NRD76640.1 hypothetical protein [Neobacillus endophyticus]
MKKIILCVIIVVTAIPSMTFGKTQTGITSPCTEILNPAKGVTGNARGVALIYNYKINFRGNRTSLSVHALHLSKPSSFGKYDGYEVLAYIPKEISWVFKLSPNTEHEETIWVGKEDEISPGYRPTHIKVRAYNTTTNKSGPVVLEKRITCT